MLESLPLVSIVLPTFNRCEMLPYALESILSQTYPNFEVIIVDDHSGDDTTEVAKTFTDPRVTYLRNEQNMKLPRTLNRGFAAARGDYMTWTSDDNMYTENAIQKMVECARENQCDFVFADYFHFSESDPKTGAALDPEHVKLPDTLQLAECNQVGACFLYSRKVSEQIGDYDPELFLIEDYDYFIRTSKKFEMIHMAEPLYYFRRHDDSLYCSRYFEVKAADLLVRYKNKLLDAEQFSDAAAALVMANTEMLRSDVLRIGLQKIQKVSFRLSKMMNSLVDAHVRRSLASRVASTLRHYDANDLSFRDSRDQLVSLLSGVVDLEYKG